MHSELEPLGCLGLSQESHDGVGVPVVHRPDLDSNPRRPRRDGLGLVGVTGHHRLADLVRRGLQDLVAGHQRPVELVGVQRQHIAKVGHLLGAHVGVLQHQEQEL